MHGWIEKRIKRHKRMSVVIQFEKGSYYKGKNTVASMMSNQPTCSIRHEFRSISCCSVDLTPEALEIMLNNCNTIRKVYLNRKVEALLDHAVPSANAENVVRNGTTLTGRGTTVAVIDTGIQPHQDLEGRITAFTDFINDRTDAYDDNGHGTHCAGDVAGDGSASGGTYAGPAPEANVIGVKVLDKMGSGSLETVMQGVEWCIDYNASNNTDQIDIISMSLGSPAQRYGTENDDPMVQIVEQAWDSGIVVCVAAGNEGPDPRTIASPGVSDQVITVGALDDRNTSETRSDDDVANFSSRGPTIYGVTKPDILAPGVNIVSLRAPGSYLDKIQKTSRVDTDYFVLSGTSMATPICAGVVALMKQHDPNLTPLQIKTQLKDGAVLWEDRDPNIYGAGYINAEESIPG